MTDFFYRLTESVTINIATLILLILTTYCFWVIKYSGITNWIRQTLHPRRRVYTLDRSDIGDITKLEKTTFKNELTTEEREIVVNFYSSRNNSKPFNGISVRLDDVVITEEDKLDLTISRVEFFDFLSTNLSIYPANSPILSFRNVLLAVRRWWRTFDLITKVKNAVDKYGNIKSFIDVVKIKSLANIITVSILIVDSENKLGIVKRSKKVAISSGHFSVTAAGTLSQEDYETYNPFLSCITREVEEELNLKGIEIVFDEVIISKQKLQPVFCFNAKIDERWEDMIDNIKLAKDFSFETNSIFAVPVNKAIPFVAHTIMTDASAYQIWKYTEKYHKKTNWLISALTPIRIRKFELK